MKLARRLQKTFQLGPRFDVRWLGGVHSAFLLLALGIWFYAFAPRFRLLPGLFAVLIWTDAAYVQYMNSFYMDTPALIFLILVTAAGLHVANNPESRVLPPVMIAASLLFATSKSQHAVSALILGLLFVGFAFLSRNRAVRRVWVAGSVVLVVAVFGMVRRDSLNYQSIGVFNIVFMRIAPGAPDPLRALQELGLGKSEMRYLRTHAYFPNSPVTNPEWVRAFALRCNHATLVRYYLRHPSVPIRFLYEDLSVFAAQLRPFGNLSLDDGFKPGKETQSTTFCYWSNFSRVSPAARALAYSFIGIYRYRRSRLVADWVSRRPRVRGACFSDSEHRRFRVQRRGAGGCGGNPAPRDDLQRGNGPFDSVAAAFNFESVCLVPERQPSIGSEFEIGKRRCRACHHFARYQSLLCRLLNNQGFQIVRRQVKWFVTRQEEE